MSSWAARALLRIAWFAAAPEDLLVGFFLRAGFLALACVPDAFVTVFDLALDLVAFAFAVLGAGPLAGAGALEGGGALLDMILSVMQRCPAYRQALMRCLPRSVALCLLEGRSMTEPL